MADIIVQDFVTGLSVIIDNIRTNLEMTRNRFENRFINPIIIFVISLFSGLLLQNRLSNSRTFVNFKHFAGDLFGVFYIMYGLIIPKILERRNRLVPLLFFIFMLLENTFDPHAIFVPILACVYAFD